MPCAFASRSYALDESATALVISSAALSFEYRRHLPGSETEPLLPAQQVNAPSSKRKILASTQHFDPAASLSLLCRCLFTSSDHPLPVHPLSHPLIPLGQLMQLSISASVRRFFSCLTTTPSFDIRRWNPTTIKMRPTSPPAMFRC